MRNPSQSQLILGKWSIQSSTNIDEDDPPFINQSGWIKFHTNNTFDTDGQPFGKMEGEWEIDDSNEVLVITVSQNMSDKSTWDLTVDKEKMEWSNEVKEVTIQLKK